MDPVAVTLEVLLKLLHAHSVDTGRAAVGDHFRNRVVKVFQVADGFHQPVTSCRAFGTRGRHAQHGPFVAGRRRFTPTLPRKGQQQLFLLRLDFPPFAAHEFSDLLATPLTPFITGDRSGLQRAASIV